MDGAGGTGSPQVEGAYGADERDTRASSRGDIDIARTVKRHRRRIGHIRGNCGSTADNPAHDGNAHGAARRREIDGAGWIDGHAGHTAQAVQDGCWRAQAAQRLKEICAVDDEDIAVGIHSNSRRRREGGGVRGCRLHEGAGAGGANSGQLYHVAIGRVGDIKIAQTIRSQIQGGTQAALQVHNARSAQSAWPKGNFVHVTAIGDKDIARAVNRHTGWGSQCNRSRGDGDCSTGASRVLNNLFQAWVRNVNIAHGVCRHLGWRLQS